MAQPTFTRGTTWDDAIRVLKEASGVYAWGTDFGQMLYEAARFLEKLETSYGATIAAEVLAEMGSYGVSEYGVEAVAEKAASIAYDRYIMMTREQRLQFLSEVTMELYGFDTYSGPDPYGHVVPNAYGCHDPRCLDSTWDHDCPSPPGPSDD